MDPSDAYIRKLDRELRSGLLSLLVLKSIKGDPEARYGYQIIERLKANSGGNLVLKEGTIYPILHSLEAFELVKAEWRESDSGPPRKYYRITPQGNVVLRRALELWDELTDSASRIIGEKDGA